jgi:hypothetical protein
MEKITEIKIRMNQGIKLIMEMDKLFERWKKIDGHDNYSVSTFGRVRNDDTGKIIKNQIRRGYARVGLAKGKKIMLTIHRLVANAFVKNKAKKAFVDHIDCNKTNNYFANLRWCSSIENNRNRSVRSNNTSGVIGVSWVKKAKKWKAQIQIGKKNKTIGLYDTKDDAIISRINKANELFGEYTHSSQKQ